MAGGDRVGRARRPRHPALRRRRARSRRCRRAGRARPRTARAALRERPGERACARELAAGRARPRAPRPPRRRPRRSSAARSSVVGERDRSRCAGSATGSSAAGRRRSTTTSTMTVRGGGSSKRLQQRVRGDSFWLHAQLLGLEQHQHLALALDRAAVRLGQHPFADVVLDLVRRAAGLELDDVGMHAALHEPHARASSSAPIEQRRELDAPRPRRPNRAGRRAGTRATGVRVGAFERVERALLTDDVGAHARDATAQARERVRPPPTPGPRPRRGVAVRVDDDPAALRARGRGTRRGRRRGTRRPPAPCGRGRRRRARSATSSGRSSTTTRSGSRPPAANALEAIDGLDAERRGRRLGTRATTA